MNKFLHRTLPNILIRKMFVLIILILMDFRRRERKSIYDITCTKNKAEKSSSQKKKFINLNMDFQYGHSS